MINKDSKWNFTNYEGRGLGGERPREWKKHMGYEWITEKLDDRNSKKKDV